MRKCIAFAAALFGFICGKAQFAPGQKMLSGIIQLGTTNGYFNNITPSQEYKGIGVSFSPTFSRFTSEKAFVSVGLMYGYNENRTNINTSGETNIHANTVGITLARTRLEKLANRFYFTYSGQFSATASFQKSMQGIPYSDGDVDTYTTGFYGGVGLLYRMNERFMFTTTLANIFQAYYSHTNYRFNSPSYAKKNSDNVNVTLFNTQNGGNVFGFGMYYLLKNK